MSLSNIIDDLSDDLSYVENAILQHVQTDIPLLTNIAEYILRSGGKRLRPALVILGAKLFGYSGSKVIQAAQVIEYLHTASLLHDDVVDSANLRRSQKTARNIWGNEASVLVGDYLFSMVFHILTSLKNLQILQIMSHTTTLMAKGELLQLMKTYGVVDEKKYLEIIFNKTACLFATALKIGAILANASEQEQNQLYEYGMAIGTAFQIVDDTLDYNEEEKKIGKPFGIDLQERKITLPLIHLLEEASQPDKDRIKAILSSELITNNDVNEVSAMMKHYKSNEYTLRIAQNYADKAVKCLINIPDSLQKTMLVNIANFIVKRQF